MGFQHGLSGLRAASTNLDVIGNNVAIANVIGFKQSQAQFSDIFANSLGGAGSNQVGIGTQVNTIAQSFSQGNISNSTNPLDMAIVGDGFFRLSDNGAISFSRNGQFHLDKSGFLVNADNLNVTGYPADKNGKKAEKPKQGTKKKDREEVKATVKTDIKPKNEKRHLAHDFTDDELRSLGDELANETMNLQNLESEKKPVVSEYKSKADEIKAKIQTISANIAARREFRWTDCEVRFNEPKTGKKTVVRLDNGTVEVANMTRKKCN